MITFTETARDKVREYMDMADNGSVGVRVVAHRQGNHHFRYELSLVLDGETGEDDTVVDQDLFKVFMDPRSAQSLAGTTVDFVSEVTGSGFTFDNPQAKVEWDDPLAKKVQRVIDERIAPSLAGHGGWIELVSVDGNAATIQFGGGCQGCGMSQVTLKDGIEAAIKQEVPEIEKVLDLTDHEQGSNPYYAR